MRHTIEMKITRETVAECNDEAMKICESLDVIGYKFHSATLVRYIDAPTIELKMVKEAQ